MDEYYAYIDILRSLAKQIFTLAMIGIKSGYDLDITSLTLERGKIGPFWSAHQ